MEDRRKQYLLSLCFGCVTNLMELKIVFSGGSSGMLCKVTSVRGISTKLLTSLYFLPLSIQMPCLCYKNWDKYWLGTIELEVAHLPRPSPPCWAVNRSHHSPIWPLWWDRWRKESAQLNTRSRCPPYVAMLVLLILETIGLINKLIRLLPLGMLMKGSLINIIVSSLFYIVSRSRSYHAGNWAIWWREIRIRWPICPI